MLPPSSLTDVRRSTRAVVLLARQMVLDQARLRRPDAVASIIDIGRLMVSLGRQMREFRSLEASVFSPDVWRFDGLYIATGVGIWKRSRLAKLYRLRTPEEKRG